MNKCIYVGETRHNEYIYVCIYIYIYICVCVCVLVPCAGRAFGPSPARSPRAGPGLYIISRAGPGRAWAYILRARAGPGLKTI